MTQLGALESRQRRTAMRKSMRTPRGKQSALVPTHRSAGDPQRKRIPLVAAAAEQRVRLRSSRRRDVLRLLDDCRRLVANGSVLALHVIGEPGAGKSKLLREWLAASEREGHLGGWLHLRTHGVPYGGYALHGWQELVAGVRGVQATPSAAAVRVEQPRRGVA